VSAEKLPAGYKGSYLGEGIVVFSGKASTRTRLHELAHKRMGHEPGRMSVSEFVSSELDAEIWAWERMDKKPNYRVGLPAYSDLISRFGYDPAAARRIVFSHLRRRGIGVGQEGGDWYLSRRISKEGSRDVLGPR